MSVKRYRMSYRDGIREDDGTLIWPADASKQMVLAEDFDAACAERDRALLDWRDLFAAACAERDWHREELRRTQQEFREARETHAALAACAERDAALSALSATQELADRGNALYAEQLIRADALAARVERLEEQNAAMVKALNEAVAMRRASVRITAFVDDDASLEASDAILSRWIAALSPQAEKLEKEGV